MLAQFLVALRATLLLAFLIGIVFPVVFTYTCQAIFPSQANGSLIQDKEGKVIGSKLIAQAFMQERYFHPRPSAAGSGYAGEASAGTNLGPCSAKLIEGLPDNPETAEIDESYPGVKQLCENFKKENQLSDIEKVPVDAVTRSGSGLDPHISLNNAFLQSRRVSKARGIEKSELDKLINKQLEPRFLGLFGEPCINVLLLNRALDEYESHSSSTVSAAR